MGERVWAAQFQQNPRPRDSTFFKVDRIVIEEAPSLTGGHSVRAWDIAATHTADSADPDWTVGLKLQRDESGRYLVLDIVRLRGSVHEVNQAVLQTARRDGTQVQIGIPQDPGSAGKFMVQQFATLLAGYNLAFSPETGAKTTRAGPVSAQVEAGNIAAVRASWTHAFIEELRDFPNGRKDDQVDAFSRAFSMLTPTTTPARRLSLALLAR